MPTTKPLLAVLLILLHHALAQNFKDVSIAAGLDYSMGPRKKYGGPTVADLNSDGHPDLIFVHHDRWFVEIYLNNGKGKFKKQPFDIWRDFHGAIPFRHSAFSNSMRFSLSPGGRAGTQPSTPLMYAYRQRDGAFVDVTNSSGIGDFGGRGRSAVYLMLKRGQHFRPDVVFTNAEVIPGFEPQQFGYQNVGRGKFKWMPLKGFADTTNEFVTVADVNNDGKMEMITYQNLSMYKIIAPFTFKEITADVFPTGIDYRGVVAIAEFDYDGDGDMDLYVCRTNTGSLQWVPGDRFDFLFENRNGVYVDVSKKAGIPQDSGTRAVTAADFDNDGWMDLYITHYTKGDLLLLNNRDGTFRTVNGLIPRPSNVRGDSAQAVDYDGDGRVDLIVGQGDRDKEAFGGFFRIFKNTMRLNNRRKYILVRVGNAPGRSATSLHAVVTVTGKGKFKAVRRVGSPGTAVSISYIELIHVGIGWRSSVDVKVRWTSGVTQTKKNVASGSKIVMGEL